MVGSGFKRRLEVRPLGVCKYDPVPERLNNTPEETALIKLINFPRMGPGIARSNNCRGLQLLAKLGQAPCGFAVYHRARSSDPWRYQRSPAVARAMPGDTRGKLSFL